MAARRYRFLEELRGKSLTHSGESLEDKSADLNECTSKCPDCAENITEENSCKENLQPLETKRSDCNEYTNECAVYADNIPEGTSLKEIAEDYERFHFNCVSEKNLNKDVSTQQISNVNFDDDLYLSDDSVVDPDYELPKKCNESNTDSEIEELGIPIITSAQVHVTLPSQDQDESFSILSSGYEIDRFHTSSPVNNNPFNNNLRSSIDRIAVTNEETICEVPDVSEDQINTKKKERSSYLSNSGPRSLPHMGGGKRHHTNGHNPRLSPPAQAPPAPNNHNQHDDLINYIYEAWNRVTRELERGNEDAKYYQEVLPPRQLANFRPFNLEEWWARRFLHSINRNKHRS